MGVSYTHGCTPDSNLAVSRVMGAASVQCRVHIAHQGLLAGQGISIYCQGVVSPWQLAALGLWSLCSTFGSPCPDMLARGFEKIVGWKKSSRISTGMVLMYKGLNFWMNCTRTLENRWDGLVGGKSRLPPPTSVYLWPPTLRFNSHRILYELCCVIFRFLKRFQNP